MFQLLNNVSFLILLLCLFGNTSLAHPAASLGTRQTATVQYITTCKTPNTVAMTFDDGPYMFSTALLDELDKLNIKATFFVNGDNWGCIYNYVDVLKRAVASGHQVAQHTWSHPSLDRVSLDELNYQVTTLEGALQKTLGLVPNYIRLPYGNGSTNDTVMNTMAGHNLRVVGWNLDSLDADNATVPQSEAVYQAASTAQPPPATFIALNHETHNTTVAELAPWAFSFFAQKGYQFATVGACQGETDPSLWYKVNVTAGVADATWVCVADDRHPLSGGF